MDKTLNLKKENIVYESDARRAIYYSIVKCPDGIIRLYSNRWVRHFNTIYVESRDGIEFDKSKAVFLQKSGACHNFSPFYDRKGKLRAMGGVDNWKHDARFHNIKNSREFQKTYVEKFQREPTGAAFNAKDHKRILSNKPILSCSDGLYLFESENGDRWKLSSDKPIISVFNDGFIDAMKNFGKGSEFDGMIGCIWDEISNQYFIYLRANIAPGFRYIQYATSPDLISWSKFQLINIDSYDASKDNYYIPSIFRYKKKFVGLVPYFDQEGNCCIRLISGSNGIDFDIKQKLFHEKTMLFKGDKPKNTCHAVYGILPRKGIINIYIHHNNLGLNEDEPVIIQRYTISEKEFDEVVLC